MKNKRGERRRGQEEPAETLCCLRPLSGHFKTFTGAGIPLRLAKKESLQLEGNSAAAPESCEGPCVAERAVKRIES